MPRYRFRWEIVPGWLTRRLARDLGLEGDPIAALRRRYGARPGEDFVRQTWPVLREVWLARDATMRRWVVEELYDAGLGDQSLPLRNRAE